ncbi:hypothetical protein HDV00_002507 [Rhizophlyctis rosea]|nr:hypothetical protein HDV00_002507 [Rhizophlyctis rosea]
MSKSRGTSQAADCMATANWWFSLCLLWLASLLVSQVQLVVASADIPTPEYLQAAAGTDVGAPTEAAGWFRLGERSRRVFEYMVRRPSTGSILFLLLAAILFVYIYGSGKALEIHLLDLYEKAALVDSEGWIDSKSGSITPSSYSNNPESRPTDNPSPPHRKSNPPPPAAQPLSPEQHHPPRLQEPREIPTISVDHESNPDSAPSTSTSNAPTPSIAESKDELAVVASPPRTKSPLPDNKSPSRSPSRRRNRHKRNASNTTNADVAHAQQQPHQQYHQKQGATSPNVHPHPGIEKKRHAGGRNQRQIASEPNSPAPHKSDHYRSERSSRDLHKSSSLTNLAALHTQHSPTPQPQPQLSPPTPGVPTHARTASKISHNRSYSTPYTLTQFAKAAEARASAAPHAHGAAGAGAGAGASHPPPAWNPAPRAWVGATPLRATRGAPPGLDTRPVRASSLSFSSNASAVSPTSLFASPPTSPTTGYAQASVPVQSLGGQQGQYYTHGANSSHTVSPPPPTGTSGPTGDMTRWYSPFVSGLSIPLDDESADGDDEFDLPAPALPSAEEVLFAGDGGVGSVFGGGYDAVHVPSSPPQAKVGYADAVAGQWGRVSGRPAPIGSSRPGMVRRSFDDEEGRGDGGLGGAGQGFSLFDGRLPFVVDGRRRV